MGNQEVELGLRSVTVVVVVLVGQGQGTLEVVEGKCMIVVGKVLMWWESLLYLRRVP